MRVFISYGSGDARGIALELSDWLASKGHEPWLDVRKGIPPGAPFDVRIELGITGSKLLIALLSPWSVRPESFCRREMLFARSKGVPIIPVRVGDVTPPIQIIELSYVEALGDIRAAFNALAGEMDYIVQNGRARAREQPAGWWYSPKLLDFNEELVRHGGEFVGREWVFKDLTDWLRRPEHRVLLLTADPGVGKSALAAQMTTRFNVRGVHFCSRTNIESCRPQAWLRGLIYQLARQLPPYMSRLEGFGHPNWGDPPESLFRTLVADPLRSCREALDVAEPWIFVIDALDESFAAAGPALSDLLVSVVERVPAWLRFLVTSRSLRDIVARFSTPAAERSHIHSDDARNDGDLRSYVAVRLNLAAERTKPGESSGALVDELASAAAGNFLFARIVLDEIRVAGLRGIGFEPGSLPRGLEGLYHRMLSTRFSDDEHYRQEVLPLLDCLVAARDALPEQLLVRASGLAESVARGSLLVLSQFLVQRDGALRLFHQSFADWLSNEASGRFCCSPRNGEQLLAKACYAEYSRSRNDMSDYSRQHLPMHLARAERWDDLLKLVNDPRLGLVRRWTEQGDGDSGIICLGGLLEYFSKRQRMAREMAGLATQLARIYSSRGEYASAEFQLDRALRTTSWCRGRRARVVALHELGSLHLYRHDSARASQCYRAALRLCRFGIPQYHDEAAANLVGLATITHSAYGHAATKKYAKRAIREAGKARDIRHLVSAMRLLGSEHKVLGEVSEARSHLELALLLCERCGLDGERPRILLLLGALQYELAILGRGTVDCAESLIRQGLDLAERMQLFYCLLDARMMLGWCALLNGRTDEAERLYRDLDASLPSGRHHELHVGIENGWATILHQKGDLDGALERYRRVIESAGGDYRAPFFWRAVIGVGAVLWDREQKDAAEQEWNKALRLAGRISQWKKAVASGMIALHRTCSNSGS